MGSIITRTGPSRKERRLEGKSDSQLVVLLCKERGSTILNMPDTNVLLTYLLWSCSLAQRIEALRLTSSSP
jgi:hypothetical protein